MKYTRYRILSLSLVVSLIAEPALLAHTTIATPNTVSPIVYEEQALAVGALWMLSVFPWETLSAAQVRQEALMAANAASIPSALYIGLRVAIRAWQDPSRLDRYVQKRLQRAGLFRELKIIDGQPITFDLFGFDEKPWETYLQVTDIILQGEKNLMKQRLLSPEESVELNRILAA